MTVKTLTVYLALLLSVIFVSLLSDNVFSAFKTESLTHKTLYSVFAETESTSLTKTA